jgi:hypothetical protein
MVGEPGGQRGGAGRLTADQGTPRHDTGLRAAYETAAGGWADGPEQVYARLAQALVAAAALPPAGCRVLDLGAGTGGGACRGRGPRRAAGGSMLVPTAG